MCVSYEEEDTWVSHMHDCAPEGSRRGIRFVTTCCTPLPGELFCCRLMVSRGTW